MHTFGSPQKILFRHQNKEAESFYTLHGEEELPLYLCPKRGYIGITTTISFPSGGTIGSCNGIFCLRTKKGFTLCNPSIKRKLNMPEFPRRSESFSLQGIGFGFDPISDDYKIVRISYVKNHSFVYAVKSGTWCEIASPKHENQICSVQHDALFFNGVLCWVIHVYQTEPKDICICCILTFDLSTHVFGMIPLPTSNGHWITTGLTTIQGELYVLGALQLQPQPTNNDDLLLNTHSHGLQDYNRKTGVLSRVGDFNDASSLCYFYQCVETLHLLDMGETMGETEEL
ncbi:unnamed protein product [Lactuca virosa]|uniref:F-box associated beta-propeller type 3 domain-containing protein n=1 Tax=Lactuca virosa TaxID=75947 RepID=A0AAU9PIE3_9ASTR|nr:unnamed protein product [Lactuca virosa]